MYSWARAPMGAPTVGAALRRPPYRIETEVKPMRIDKYLSLMGYTRKQAKALCAAGRVQIDGQPVRDAAVHIKDDQPIFVDGAPLTLARHRHLMVHKPQGVLTATEDARGQKTVLDLIPEGARRSELGPVGRLDRDVSGLVILTTDGQLAHRLIAPKWVIEKRYRAVVEGLLTDSDIERMAAGIPLKDFTASPARMVILASNDDQSTAELYVTEGKYHQVKRMFGALGHPVLRLYRLSIGGIGLDESLAPGEWRALTDSEIKHLYTIVNMEAQ